MNRILKLFLIAWLIPSVYSFGQEKVYNSNEIDQLPVVGEYVCDKNDTSKKCFQDILSSYFKDNFEYSDDQFENDDELIAYSQFIITTTKKIKDIKVRSQNEEFKTLVKLVLSEIPVTSTAIKNGEPVDMIFSMPFYYKLEKRTEEISFDFPESLDSIPVYPGCEGKNDIEGRQCFKEKLQNHIRKNFKYPKEAVRKKMQGRVIVSIFIDENGSISNIKTDSPHAVLTEQALSITKALPKFGPAYKQGEPVKTVFSFPIQFLLL